MNLISKFDIKDESHPNPTSQKKNRNSKRRKANILEFDENSKIEEIVQLLSQSIARSEPELSICNSSVAPKNNLKVTNHVSHFDKKTQSHGNRIGNINITSPAMHLVEMFKNFQINSSKQSVKSKKKNKCSKTESSTQTDDVASCGISNICCKCTATSSKVSNKKNNSLSGRQIQNQCKIKDKENKNSTGKIVLNKCVEESVNLIKIKKINNSSKKAKKSKIVVNAERKSNSVTSEPAKKKKNPTKKSSKITLSDVEKSLTKCTKVKKLLKIEKTQNYNRIQNKLLYVEFEACSGNEKKLQNSCMRTAFKNSENRSCCCNVNSSCNSKKSNGQEGGRNCAPKKPGNCAPKKAENCAPKKAENCAPKKAENCAPKKVENCAPKPNTEFQKYFTVKEMENVAKLNKLFSGVIRINQRNYQEAYIAAPDRGSDILIAGLLDRNRALEGDEVYYVMKSEEHFRINPETEELQRTAVVVALKSLRHTRNAVGTLTAPSKSSLYATFSPRDSRIPRMRIKKQNWPHGFAENPENFKNKIFLARIVNWKDIRYAEGEIIREVGVIGDINAETSAIMLMNDLDESEYSDSLKKFMPNIPYVISEKDYFRRLDFRQECIFTIDPVTAKDLDDAISFKLLPSGNYQIGVHISDVTYFLKDETPLDKAVCNRANSVYLVQKVYHMLPKELCELCSLSPGEDKLCFSVVWEMTPEPEFTIINKFFTRSVINSCGQFSYEQIQSLLDGTDLSMPNIRGDHSLSEITKAIKYLNKVAIHLRKTRFSNGALSIDQTKIMFSLDNSSLPLDYSVYVNTGSHQLIEELMLLANISVAEKISLRFPKIAFLRSHAPPSPYVMRKIQTTLEKCGVPVDTSSSKSISSFLLQHSGSDPKSVAKMMVLNSLLAKPMARAKYYCADKYQNCEERRHYALNIPMYTHFTSPIRRYSDIIVHRLLAASLGYRNNPKLSADKMEMIAEICNRQKHAAKMASDKSTDLYLAIYTMLRGPFVCTAVVSDVKDRSLDCITLENGYHYRIYYQSVKAKSLVKNENGIYKVTIVWPETDHEKEFEQKIEIFSIIKVEVKHSTDLKIKATLLKDTNLIA